MTQSADGLDHLTSCYQQFLKKGQLVLRGGKVVSISANHYRVRGMADICRLGDIVHHEASNKGRRGEIVQIDSREITIAPFRDSRELTIGDIVINRGQAPARPSQAWLGRVVNALCEPLDGNGPLAPSVGESKTKPPGGPMGRSPISQAFRTGVRAVDIFTPLCFGQRFGVFAGSGVGKSTLLAMLAHADAFDVIVVAMVGERAREAREFVAETLGADDMAKAVVVVSTSEESAMMRRRAPETALQIAEYFRDSGKSVLLLVDSVTRYAHALREVAISLGEPPVARGYPASVFSDLPRMLERAGPGADGEGSITAIITVLVDGDDHNDPVADALRGILDGHLVLDREIANQGRYPAINPLASISRLSNRVWSDSERELVLSLRSMINRFEETRDLRLLGAWQPGADPVLDKAVETVPAIYQALCQSPGDLVSDNPFADLAASLRGDAGQSAPDDADQAKVEETGGNAPGKFETA